MSESDKKTDIIDRLHEACVGHPHAKIHWPHYLLHDAVSEIEALRKELSECKAERDEAHNVINGTEALHNAGIPAAKIQVQVSKNLAKQVLDLKAENEVLRKANDSYTYIGRDGKAVLAKDLEAQLTTIRNETIDECADIALDEDGEFTDWAEDRNRKISRRTANSASAAILKLKETT